MNDWPLFATIRFFNVVASENCTLRHCLVMRLSIFNIVALHQVACIKVGCNMDTVGEFERITAGKDVPELIVLCDILAACALPTLLLLASLIYLPLLIVPIDVVGRLKLIVTILGVVRVTIHLFVFPY